jgi:hypothetical protein
MPTAGAPLGESHADDVRDLRPGPAARAAVDALRRRERADLQAFEVHRAAADLVRDALNRVGRFYHAAGTSLYQPADADTMLEVSAEDLRFGVLLQDGFSLNPAEPITQFVLQHLRLEAFRAGPPPAGVPGAENPTLAPTSGRPARENRELISLSEAAELYDIPKATLSKAARKQPGSFGYLRSEREGRRVYFYRQDITNFRRSRLQRGN